jgi:hypothetical protein
MSAARVILLHHTSVTSLPPLGGTTNTSKAMQVDLSSNPSLTGAIPASWGSFFGPTPCMALHATALCGAVPNGMPCFNKGGTNLGGWQANNLHVGTAVCMRWKA